MEEKLPEQFGGPGGSPGSRPSKSLEKFSIPEGLSEEDRKMMLDPLGYDAIKDIDEIHQRNRRKSDDPYIKATSEKIAHRFPKIDDAERR